MNKISDYFIGKLKLKWNQWLLTLLLSHIVTESGIKLLLFLLKLAYFVTYT